MKLKLTLQRSEEGPMIQVKSLDEVEAENLTELLSKFMFLIARTAKAIETEKIELIKSMNQDDIPF
jgi:hypothetical protein